MRAKRRMHSIRLLAARALLVGGLLAAQVTLASSALGAPGDLTLASTSETGAKGNGRSTSSSLSADGTRVAFMSNSTNLVPHTEGINQDHVYIKSLVTGEAWLMSCSDTGAKGNGRSSYPSLSADGTRVAFESTSTNLDPADTDSDSDVYVKELSSVEFTLFLTSTSDTGAKGNGTDWEPSASADGTRVAFESTSTNLDPADTDSDRDVYIKDLTSGEVTLASTSDTGVKGNKSSSMASLSANGTRVAFMSTSTNLDPADTSLGNSIFVKDLASGEVTPASTSTPVPTAPITAFNRRCRTTERMLPSRQPRRISTPRTPMTMPMCTSRIWSAASLCWRRPPAPASTGMP